MIDIFCQFCKKKFEVFPSRRAAKYCSLDCRFKAQNGKALSKEHVDSISRGLKGKSLSEKHKQNLKGRKPGNWNPDREDQHKRNRAAKIYYTLIGRAVGWKKKDRTVNELGYTPSDLRIHLESLFREGMSWENHGKGPGCWHVDHVRPISDFELGTPPNIVNALSNLQPLWEDENLSKGGIRRSNGPDFGPDRNAVAEQLEFHRRKRDQERGG